MTPAASSVAERHPRVTVLMAVYNGEAYLRDAVDSVLAQSFGDLEFLIIDDGSTDRSSSILSGYSDPRIRVIRHVSNAGLTRSLNAGLRIARGALIARHDADDVSHRHRIAAQVAAFDERPSLAVAGTNVRVIDDRGRPSAAGAWIRCTTPLAIRWQVMFENPFVHGTVMYRRDVILDQLGGYDESFRSSQDVELWSRVVPRHDTTNLSDVLVDFRVHSGSVSSRYALEGVEKVRQLLRRNLVEALGPGDYEAWLDFWVTVNNVKTYGRIDGLATFDTAFAGIARRFVDLHPEAGSDGEIAAQIAGAFGRVSCAIARFDRAAALRAFRIATRWSARTALPWMPRLAVALARRRSQGVTTMNEGVTR